MKQQKGFTLLETLVALVLMSLLVMALFGGFRAGLRSWHAAEKHVAWVEEPRQLSSLLYRHLSQFVPIRVGQPSFDIIYLFSASADRLLYVAPLAMSVGDELHVFEMVNGHHGQPGLWARFAPVTQNTNQTDQELLADVEYVQISENLSAQFSYYFEEAWLDSLEVGQLPTLIKVNLQLSSGQEWPSLVFAVRTVGLE